MLLAEPSSPILDCFEIRKRTEHCIIMHADRLVECRYDRIIKRVVCNEDQQRTSSGPNHGPERAN